jgi:hypothetical protein
MPMKRIKIFLLASGIFAGLIAGNSALASDDDSFAAAKAAASPSAEPGQEPRALRHLAAALAAGGDAWNSFHRAKVADEETKERLDLAIADMNCSVDEIANYVACYGVPLASREAAELRFTGLIHELQSVPLSKQWRGAESEPRIGSIRSYSCEDQDSQARIDIDIAPQWSPDEEVSYVVTIFGWPANEPRL